MKLRISYFLVLAIGLLVSVGAKADIPSGYYDSLEGLSGVELKKAVKAAARSHTAIDYGTETWKVFIESDTRYVGGQRTWWDMYSNNNVAATSYAEHDGLNIEHSVANSWWGGTKNDAYKDLMHLNPSNSDANSRKSNYPLGEIQNETWNNGVTFIGKPKSGDCGGASYVYEPADEYKGDFARVFFYMFTIYDDISWRTSNGYGYMYDTSSSLLLKPWAYEMLLKWAQNDPVSQKELDRNEVIYKHQRNRNPFIDYPELAQHIWGSKKNTPFHLDGTVDPNPDPDPDPTPDPNPVPGTTYELTEDFGLASGFPMGSANRPSSATSYTSSKTGIVYNIMGCYVNNYETPYYLLVNGKNNPGAFISFSLDDVCTQIILNTTGSCSTNPSSAVNIYADGNLIGKYAVNAYNTAYPVEIPLQYQKAGTLYKIESATSSYNQQFSGFTYVCSKETLSGDILQIETEPATEFREIYNINGLRVKDEIDTLAPGLYIIRESSRTYKLLVK